MVPMWMFPVAIACGNTFVLKPCEQDPSAPIAASPSCGARPGLPDGVFNVVHGDKEAVDALLAHPDVAAVSFVGSTPIARYVYETGTAHGKRVQALGGAKNHMRRAARRRPGPGRRRRVSAPATARPGSAAWRSRSPSPSAAPPSRWWPRSSERMAHAARRPTAPIRTPTWARSSPSAHRDKVAGYIDAGAGRGRDPRRRRPRPASSTATSRATSSARRCSTTSRPA